MQALGILEGKGFVTLLKRRTMVKAANVEFLGWDKPGSGIVTVHYRHVAPLKKHNWRQPLCVAYWRNHGVQVIPRPNSDVEKFFRSSKSLPSRRDSVNELQSSLFHTRYS